MGYQRARRARIYQDRTGNWRYRIQGGNWRTIDAPEESFNRKSTARRRVEQRWPNVEEIIEE